MDLRVSLLAVCGLQKETWRSGEARAGREEVIIVVTQAVGLDLEIKFLYRAIRRRERCRTID